MRAEKVAVSTPCELGGTDVPGEGSPPTRLCFPVRACGAEVAEPACWVWAEPSIARNKAVECPSLPDVASRIDQNNSSNSYFDLQFRERERRCGSEIWFCCALVSVG